MNKAQRIAAAIDSLDKLACREELAGHYDMAGDLWNLVEQFEKATSVQMPRRDRQENGVAAS